MKLVPLVAAALLAACSYQPGPKSPPADDPWEDYGLDGQTAEGDEDLEPRRDPDPGPTRDPDAMEPIEPFPEPPPRPNDDLPPIDPTPTRTGQRFDQTLEITVSSGKQSMFSTFEVLNDLVRQDDFADEGRRKAMTSQIRRGGGTLYLDHGTRKQSFSPSAFGELNDPTVVFYFDDLKAKKKWKKTRSATYQGTECDIYEKPAPARLQQSDILWVTRDPPGFLLRYSSKNMLGIETVMTRTVPQEAQIDPARFEAPADYSR